VVKGQHVLLGIITHDDAIDVIHQEHTEDMEKFMAIFFSTAKLLLGIWSIPGNTSLNNTLDNNILKFYSSPYGELKD
jgi:hypothetical protein